MANINTQVKNIEKGRKIIDYAIINDNEIEPSQDWGGFSTETLWFILSNPPSENDNVEPPIEDTTEPSEGSSDDNIDSSENGDENSTAIEDNNEDLLNSEGE